MPAGSRTNSPRSEEFHFSPWQVYLRYILKNPSKTSIRSTSMLMVNYGVLQLLTDLASQELPNVPTLMSCVSLSDHDPVTLRTGQQINGCDVNGFNQRPEPGFFRKRIFKWPLEGVCLTEFAEHERWLHDVSTQLWLKKGHVEPTEVRCLSGTVGALTGAQAEAPLFSQGLPGASLCRRAPAVSCEASTAAHFWKKTVTALLPPSFTIKSQSGLLFWSISSVSLKPDGWNSPGYQRASLKCLQATLMELLRSSRAVVVGPSCKDRPKNHCCAEL